MNVQKITEVLGTKVYTDAGDFFGEIEEVNYETIKLMDGR